MESEVEVSDAGDGGGVTLRSMATTPPLRDYVAELWQRREFTWTLATGTVRGQYLDTMLGNVWHVLNPALLMIVYYVIFGLLIGTNRGVDNFLGFLSTGIFTYGLATRTITSCGASIHNNINLIRSLQFPRAVLPIATTLEQVTGYGFSATVIVGILLLTGEGVTLQWLLAPVIVGLLTIFSAGLGLMVARLTDNVRDVANALPFIFRLLFYMSGILFALTTFVTTPRLETLGIGVSGSQVRHAFVLNPFFTYIELLRDVLMTSYTAEHARDAWIVAIVYAPVSLLVGIVYFRGAERRYGRG